MALYVFLPLLIIALTLIGSSRFTGINRAAVAIALAAVCWVVYVSWGADFVTIGRLREYLDYLGGNTASSETVKQFIHDRVFIIYVGRAASLALYLLATSTIVRILDQNGCFDFITRFCRAASSRVMMWRLVAVTFFISANLDNLTTTLLMLAVLRQLVEGRHERWLLGTAIVVAACCGGCFTVIGDPLGLLLWGQGAVTATAFSAKLTLPCLLACGITCLLIGRQLPPRINSTWQLMPYRGNATRLKSWQRLGLLFTALVGLWFVPTFYNITHLNPFLGALCVLAVLWVVNEAFNRKLLEADQMTSVRRHRSQTLGSQAQLLYVVGIMLAMGVMVETNVFTMVNHLLGAAMGNIWGIGLVSALLSSVTDSLAIAICDASLHPVVSHADLQQLAVDSSQWGNGAYLSQFLPDGDYWTLIALFTTLGGLLLPIGNMSGLALMSTEQLHPGWYLRHCTPAVLAASLAAILVLAAELFFF